MIKNYFKIAVRNLKRNKIYSVINIGGLSAGFACCLLIFYFIDHEYTYDKFHIDSDNIYRITTEVYNESGGLNKMINTPPALVPALRGLFPEVDNTTRLRYTMRTLLQKDDNSFYETNGFYADSVFFDVFSFELKEGSQSSVLDEPNSIVLTEAMAAKYFGKTNPVGEFLIMNNNTPLKVTGILNSIPTNSHIQFDFLISFSTFRIPDGYLADLTSWGWLGFLSYVKLAAGSNPAEFKDKLDQLYVDRTSHGRIPYKAGVQELKDIYLGSAGLKDDLASNIRSGNEFTINALITIAILVLLVAGFNFLNLKIAFSVNRRKEIGVRKVLGADKSKLIIQILIESLLIIMISIIISYAITIVIFPYLKHLLAWDLMLQMNKILYTMPFILLFALIFGILAGLYPSSLLSGIKTVTALKGVHNSGTGRSQKLRNSLIMLQFGISIGLIVSTIIITKQISYMRDKELGFDKENILVVKLLSEDMTRYYNSFKNVLLQNKDVLNISRSDRLMGDPWPANPIFTDGQDRSEAKLISGNWVDYDYLETMGISLKEGRPFSREFAGDSLRSIIINEKAVEYLGLTNPVGTRLNYFSFDGPRTVIGVVENFNFSSLHQDIVPAVLIMPFINLENMFIRIAPGNISEKIVSIENSWKQIAGVPLDIQFMDDHLNQLYSKEEKLSYLVSGFSILAVVLACLGLYGLIASMINNRKKEIGVRKVLGASVSSLVFIFLRQYLLIVAMAALISVPVTEYVLNLWLENFAYRIDVSWWFFMLGGGIALSIALLTVSFQAIKAATANPVKSLKYE
ncbi:MAG: FtsX-like permease family protein [Ignavibacteriaceae bacterium]